MARAVRSPRSSSLTARSRHPRRREGPPCLGSPARLVFARRQRLAALRPSPDRRASGPPRLARCARPSPSRSGRSRAPPAARPADATPPARSARSARTTRGHGRRSPSSVSWSSPVVASSRISRRGSVQQSAGDRDPLPLPARKAVAALADDGLQLLRQLGHEVPGAGRLQGAGSPPRRRRRPRTTSRCCGRCRGTAAPPAARSRCRCRQAARSSSRRSVPSTRTAPAVGLVEADQQVDQGRLADARWAHQRGDLARWRSPGRGPAGWAACRRRTTRARTASIRRRDGARVPPETSLASSVVCSSRRKRHGTGRRTG